MQAWAMELGQRILKVHGDSQQVADCLTKITTPRAAHRKALEVGPGHELAAPPPELRDLRAAVDGLVVDLPWV